LHRGEIIVSNAEMLKNRPSAFAFFPGRLTFSFGAQPLELDYNVNSAAAAMNEPKRNRPLNPPAGAGPAEGAESGTHDSAQLSACEGVFPSVSSLAIEAGRLYGSPSAAGRPGSAPLPLSGEAEGLSDAEVMLRVKAGEDGAFDYLVSKYRRPMLSFMYRMVHNTSVAEELAQEVFLRVYRSRASYSPTAKFSTWLYRIATNLAVNHARDTRHERPEVQVSIDEPDPETGLTLDVADTKLTVEQRILRRERLAAIRRHVDALPERQRLAVLMHKYQGMDYRQIGEVLKLSEAATKSLLFRAYETLREKLKDFV
jgi:RNA polymerase sigma-70 factor (ECF subfamily)